MILWSEIEARQLEHEQRVLQFEHGQWMQDELPAASVGRWQWRLMSKLGGWLVEWGCRLQTHVERAQKVVHTSHMTMEANSNSTQPRL